MLGKSCIDAVGLDHASPATVQALHLLGTYILNDKRESIPKHTQKARCQPWVFEQMDNRQSTITDVMWFVYSG